MTEKNEFFNSAEAAIVDLIVMVFLVYASAYEGVRLFIVGFE